MPLFLIERNFADKVEMDHDEALRITRVNDDEKIKWLYSFLSADKKKTYCLYEAASAAAIREAARRLGLPADVIIEVADTIRPEAYIGSA